MTNNHFKTEEEVRYIIKNFKDKSVTQLSHELNLTNGQVNATIQQAKKQLRELISNEENSELKEKYEKLLNDYLSKKTYKNTQKNNNHEQSYSNTTEEVQEEKDVSGIIDEFIEDDEEAAFDVEANNEW